MESPLLRDSPNEPAQIPSQKQLIASPTKSQSGSNCSPQNPHQSYKLPPMCVKLPDGFHQKNTDNALFDHQVHVAHLNCLIDFMTVETVGNYIDWRHPNDDAFCWYRALHIQIRSRNFDQLRQGSQAQESQHRFHRRGSGTQPTQEPIT
ncbi:hypothetical protein BGZ90_012153 [Linnemannia elongata]|nr:hypothetical protein BGZ90_012153 [Linnemannia elongata]